MSVKEKCRTVVRTPLGDVSVETLGDALIALGAFSIYQGRLLAGVILLVAGIVVMLLRRMFRDGALD